MNLGLDLLAKSSHDSLGRIISSKIEIDRYKDAELWHTYFEKNDDEPLCLTLSRQACPLKLVRPDCYAFIDPDLAEYFAVRKSLKTTIPKVLSREKLAPNEIKENLKTELDLIETKSIFNIAHTSMFSLFPSNISPENINGFLPEDVTEVRFHEGNTIEVIRFT